MPPQRQMTANVPKFKLLLVGEGDFTLALSLATQLTHVSITATGVDAEDDLVNKYRDAPATLRRLRTAGATARHGVDACDLTGSYDEVHFGHPHLGVENAVAHHRLLAHYFHSASTVAPVVRVTLASDQSERWRCDAAAARAGLELKSTTPFHDDVFPGYTRRRSLNGGSFRARTAEASYTLTYAKGAAAVAPVAWARLPRRAEQLFCPTCARPCRDARGLTMHLQTATCAYAPPARPPLPPPPPPDDPVGCAICGASLPCDAARNSRGLRVDGVRLSTHCARPETHAGTRPSRRSRRRASRARIARGRSRTTARCASTRRTVDPARAGAFASSTCTVWRPGPIPSRRGAWQSGPT